MAGDMCTRLKWAIYRKRKYHVASLILIVLTVALVLFQFILNSELVFKNTKERENKDKYATKDFHPKTFTEKEQLEIKGQRPPVQRPGNVNNADDHPGKRLSNKSNMTKSLPLSPRGNRTKALLAPPTIRYKVPQTLTGSDAVLSQDDKKKVKSRIEPTAKGPAESAKKYIPGTNKIHMLNLNQNPMNGINPPPKKPNLKVPINKNGVLGETKNLYDVPPKDGKLKDLQQRKPVPKLGKVDLNRGPIKESRPAVLDSGVHPERLLPGVKKEQNLPPKANGKIESKKSFDQLQIKRPV